MGSTHYQRKLLSLMLHLRDVKAGRHTHCHITITCCDKWFINVTMECKSESKDTCKLFLKQINKMLRIHTSDDNACFNPAEIKDDEHGGNKIGIATVLGEDALQRTSSCGFHYNLSVKNHKRFVAKEDRKTYKKLANQLKEATSSAGFYCTRQEMEDLILRQRDGDRKPLLDALVFGTRPKSDGQLPLRIVFMVW